MPTPLTPPLQDNYPGFNWRVKGMGNINQQKVEGLAAYDWRPGSQRLKGWQPTIEGLAAYV